jgi:cytidine deaminase
MTDASTAIPADQLHALLDRAHAPYSGVRVACAVEAVDGGLHFGVNVENAAYPQGLCAEASAIAAAVTAGANRLTRVFIASSLEGPVWPCGGCRQKIWEFAAPACEVVTVGPEGVTARRAIEALLPDGFRLDPSQVRG